MATQTNEFQRQGYNVNPRLGKSQSLGEYAAARAVHILVGLACAGIAGWQLFFATQFNPYVFWVALFLAAVRSLSVSLEPKGRCVNFCVALGCRSVLSVCAHANKLLFAGTSHPSAASWRMPLAVQHRRYVTYHECKQMVH